MYRVFLLIAFLTYCSSFPFSGPNVQKSVIITTKEEPEIVDNVGAGYSYFSKQDIEGRPSFQSPVSIPIQAFSAPIKTIAIQQQPLITRSNLQVQTVLPKLINVQQPVLFQKDFSQVHSPISSGFNTEQINVPLQPNHFIQRTFGTHQQPQKDLRTIDSLQILLPRTTLNNQQNTFTSFGNQKEILSIPQSTWSTHQNSAGFTSFVGGQGQQPISSSFAIHSNQQNDMKPVTNAVFMSSQFPTRRIIAQSQPVQQVSNNGWVKK